MRDKPTEAFYSPYRKVMVWVGVFIMIVLGLIMRGEVKI
jgi:hypothetical protein